MGDKSLENLKTWEIYKDHSMIAASLTYQYMVPPPRFIERINFHRKVCDEIDCKIFSMGLDFEKREHVRKGLNKYADMACKYAQIYHSNKDHTELFDILNAIDKKMKSILRNF